MRLRFMTLLGICFLLTGSNLSAQGRSEEKALPDRMWEVLRGVEEIEVVVIDPAGDEVFVEWKHRGKATASGPAVRKAIIDALEEGVKKAGKKGKGKFMPEYGVRATSGGAT